MRRVRIVDEPDKTYAYAAVDQRTGEIPLRHHDRTELIALCRRLEWRIEEAEQDRQGSDQRQRQAKRALTGSTKLLASPRTNKRGGDMRASAS